MRQTALQPLSILSCCVLLASPLRADEPDWARLRDAAEHGEAAAQLAVAKVYRDGKGVPRDYAKAFALFGKSAAQGNLEAMGGLAAMYILGRGTEVNGAEGVKWLRKAAELGSFPSATELASVYAHGNAGIPRDYSAAIHWYRHAADQGYVDAQLRLGLFYFFGEEYEEPKREPNYEAAFHWLSLAADAGKVRAFNALGVMYEEGRYVKQDTHQAFALFQKAAEQKDPRGQGNMGRMYLGTEDIPEDLPKAYCYLKLAATKGDVPSQNILREAFKMTPEEMAEARRLMRELEPETTARAEAADAKLAAPSLAQPAGGK
jgi:hypothetical protein